MSTAADDAGRKLRVLLVDDNPDDRALVLRSLRRELGPVEAVEVLDAEGLQRALSAGADLTITDYRLGWTDGLQVLRTVKRRAADHPVVMFTGTGSEEVAVAGMREGLDDYVPKTPRHYARLPASVRTALANARRRRAERAVEKAAEQLAHAATHDSLTGLPNRGLLADRLSQALARVRHDGGRLAVLFLDVDRLRIVNEALGHEAGDAVLAALSGRLLNVVRPGDTVARVAGDGLVVLHEGWSDLREVIRIGERLLAGVRTPNRLGDREFVVTASLGISVSHRGDEDPGALIRDAGVAMRRAKDRGGDRMEVFNAEMRADLLGALDVEHALRDGLSRGGLHVHYQRLVRLADGFGSGLEALARLDDGDGEPITPDRFIPIAEDVGLISSVGRRVMQQACETAKTIGRLRDAPARVSVNLSAWELAQPRLPIVVAGVLDDCGLPPDRLCLEITESAVMASADDSVRTLGALKDLGVQLAIDDFGTGYSSLAYLQRFPVDYLKIDRSFVAALGPLRSDRTMVAAITSLAHALGVQVVAEGVETQPQLDAVTDLGCDYAQGFLFGSPMPPDVAIADLTTARKRPPAR